MTASPLSVELIELVGDLSRALPPEERYRRLLASLRRLFPSDATALLRLEHETLVPLAVDGLSPDTLGRRFRLAEHPRFSAIVAAGRPIRFAQDSELPDPYDGLVADRPGHLPVHDCLGLPLHIDGQVWGVLTLDSLAPGSFDGLPSDELLAFVALAAATVKAADLISALESRVEREHQAYVALKEATTGAARRELVGDSPAMRQLRQEIAMVAGTDLAVLIDGETGVGKELVARAIHLQSARAEQPLVELNCAALPENLIESELFGHVKGAFSGAVGDRRGKFDLAHGGTLFLDEVGELPPAAQAKLLRALQSGEIQRVGSDRSQRVDVRILAATNRDLQEEVRAGRFRADLYHRLGVFPVRVPALRERSRDALLLAGYFLEQNRARLGLQSLRLAADCQPALLRYEWPGNVRELEHLVSRAALRARAEAEPGVRVVSVHLHHLGLQEGAAFAARMPTAALPVDQCAEPVGGLREAVDAFQRQAITRALAATGDNWAQAARLLELDRGNLFRLARRLGMREG